jgi:hypothetical protein
MSLSTTRTIHTSYCRKPVPTDSFDWTATFDDYDGAPESPGVPSRDPVGHGPTEAAAIADLVEQEEDAASDRFPRDNGHFVTAADFARFDAEQQDPERWDGM